MDSYGIVRDGGEEGFMLVSVSILLRWRLSDPSGYIGGLMAKRYNGPSRLESPAGVGVG